MQICSLPRAKIPIIDETFTPHLHRFLLEYEKPDKNHYMIVDGCRVPMSDEIIRYYCHRCTWCGHDGEEHDKGITIGRLVEDAAKDQVRRYGPNVHPRDNMAYAKKFFQLGLYVINVNIDILPHKDPNRIKQPFRVIDDALAGLKLQHKSADKIVKYYNEYAKELVRSDPSMYELVSMADTHDMADLFLVPDFLPSLTYIKALEEHAYEHMHDWSIYRAEIDGEGLVRLGNPDFCASVMGNRKASFWLPSLAACAADLVPEFWDDRVYLRIFLATALSPYNGSPYEVDPAYVQNCVNLVKGRPMTCKVSPAMIGTIIQSGLPALKKKYAKRLATHAAPWPQINLDSSEYIRPVMKTVRCEKSCRENRTKKEGRSSKEPVSITTCKGCMGCGRIGHFYTRKGSKSTCLEMSSGDVARGMGKFIQKRLATRQGSPFHLAFVMVDFLLCVIETRIYELEIDMLEGKKGTEAEVAWRKNLLVIRHETRNATHQTKTANCSTYLAAWYMAMRQKLMEIDHPEIIFTTAPDELGYPSMGIYRSPIFDNSGMKTSRLFLRNNFFKVDENDFLNEDNMEIMTPHPAKRRKSQEHVRNKKARISA